MKVWFRFLYIRPEGSCEVATLFLGPWDARIGDGSTGVLAEKPGQIRRAILRVTAEIVEVWAAEIAEQQGTATGVPPIQSSPCLPMSV